MEHSRKLVIANLPDSLDLIGKDKGVVAGANARFTAHNFESDPSRLLHTLDHHF